MRYMQAPIRQPTPRVDAAETPIADVSLVERC
jgi:hypothetical protein